MLERLGAERMAVADLDPEPLEEGGVDRLRGARRARLRGMLRQLTGARGLKFFLRLDLDLVQANAP